MAQLFRISDRLVGIAVKTQSLDAFTEAKLLHFLQNTFLGRKMIYCKVIFRKLYILDISLNMRPIRFLHNIFLVHKLMNCTSLFRELYSKVYI